jgi:hypothetical protein
MRLWKRASPQPLAFEAFGVQVQIALGDPELESRVREILPPEAKPCRPRESVGRFALRQTGDDSYEVMIGDQPWLEHGTLDVAIGMLDAQVRLFVAATAPDAIFVHAGVVAQDGRALVIPGESFSGKTTLVSALVQAGATYYSDEYAVLDLAGRVHPYPRPLSIRSSDGSTVTERHVADLGGTAAEGSAEVATVVVTRYRAGCEWRPKRLSPGRGLVALLANTVPAQERPKESLEALNRALAAAIVLESDRGEAALAAASILESLATLAR